MHKGNIGVTTENIFPIIKKFLYSEHEIFLRELISNAVDASNKLKALASTGEYKGDTEHLRIHVSIDKNKKTLKISDQGIGMTAEEVDKYINQIAFSSAEDFLAKYKDKTTLIGHFGLGFYSAFMVANKVELITKSYKEDAKAVKWTCNGSPEYTLEETERDHHGTDVILYIEDKENEEFLNEDRIRELLKKYCRFLPIEIAFGKKKKWEKDKLIETDEDEIINNTKPLWTQKPVDLKDEDYKNFYRELYPDIFDEPLFNIHLNVDYPFNLTGILYFPKIKNNFDIQKNKIQLYCNQVYVTDQVEDIVPDYLMLLHGVIDSPDIPLNVSRSYLQGDPNVKKISSHITKKVADKLYEIFKNQREEFEKKWDDLKLFIQYGMISDEKFYERAEKFALLKNVDGKYFTLEEYEKLVKENQTEKYGTTVYLYATDKEEQYTYIEQAKNKGYDVLFFDGQLDMHFINHLEQKLKKTAFKRVDAETIDKLIEKDEQPKIELSEKEQNNIRHAFFGALTNKDSFLISFEAISKDDMPIVITRSEYMRRMKDMSQFAPKSFYGNMPDMYTMVVNANHPLIKNISSEIQTTLQPELNELDKQIEDVEKELNELRNKQNGKKDEEIPQTEKDAISEKEKQLDELKKQQKTKLETFGSNNKTIQQLIDIALLSHNLLKGEAFNKFIKRSLELIK
ncbi:MAG: molecular chaperone HtpG [Bacteroidales bacterium]|nr:molecular chaperone HtpG [Bacteroidales bacterium]